ncbi:alkene reductase [Streptomyces platensis]|uniref:Alkene reductase n=1 Tax=Streptomyces platensis TaxID=58346 RepID=A0AAE6TMP0_STRPT|nr:alkene reductase [Streptomyces platensis]OSY46929.1 N-ethylmaleimide reductase [Streptomyces platensis]QEV50883.1 alkene reductase [Streptomyces platensis]
MSSTLPTTPDQPLLWRAELGDLTLPNRVVMAPLTRARVANDALVPTELIATYYGQRATAGLIITEGTWVSERAIGFVNVPGIYREEQIAGWRRVTGLVHALGGRIVLQLWHTGAASHPDHLGGELPGGPSAVNPRTKSFTADGFKDTVTPREMTTADIAATVDDFRAAAANARRAGFDGVEIGALGAFLITQFLNPRLNLRTDAYGGDPAGRRRLLLEIVDAVAEPWPGRRVGVRLGPYWSDGDRFRADEETLTDYDALVTELNDRPVAYLHLRGPDRTAADGGPDLAALARYRRRFDGPLVANNGFDRESGNAVIEAGIADAVSFGTHFIANPDLVTRFALRRAPAVSDPATYYTGGAEGYVDHIPSGSPARAVEALAP